MQRIEKNGMVWWHAVSNKDGYIALTTTTKTLIISVLVTSYSVILIIHSSSLYLLQDTVLYCSYAHRLCTYYSLLCYTTHTPIVFVLVTRCSIILLVHSSSLCLCYTAQCTYSQRLITYVARGPFFLGGETTNIKCVQNLIFKN